MGLSEVNRQSWKHLTFYAIFGIISFVLMTYYLSNTLIHFTTARQFPINSFIRFPLTLLIFPAEVFSFLFSFYFIYLLFSDRYKHEIPKNEMKSIKTEVAVLLPVYNEPAEIVERTLNAAKNIKWNSPVNVYILDDSDNSKDMENINLLGKKYSSKIIRRPDRKGYKAGNINYAFQNAIKEDYFVIFDSDQAPKKEFLEEAMPYFNNEQIAFVQTAQDFITDGTPLSRAAKIGTNIFYFAQCSAKAQDGAMPFCGTNVIVKSEVFRKVGGFSYYTSTEDIDLGIRMNAEGFRGAYVSKVLAQGYTPPDFKAYSSQQYRWANGNLAILKEYWLKLIGGNFPFRYQMHMFFTLGWWLIGLVSLIYVIVPILSITFGLGTHHTWLPSLLLAFLFANVIIGISMIYVSLNKRVENEKVTLLDVFLQYSLITNSMFIYARAALNALVFKRYIGFVTTNKKKTSTGISLIKWNLILAVVCFGFSIYALYHALISSEVQQFRTYLPVSLWLLFYSVMLGSSILFIGKTKGAK